MSEQNIIQIGGGEGPLRGGHHSAEQELSPTITHVNPAVVCEEGNTKAGSEESKKTAAQQRSPTMAHVGPTTICEKCGSVANAEAGESSRALVGKIARLPKDIREKLNRRMDDGEPGSKLAEWLNGLPSVKRMLAVQFDGKPINERNISRWRCGGFKRWQKKQEFLDELKTLAEDAEDINQTSTKGFLRSVATVAATKLLKLLQDESGAHDPVKIAFAIAALGNLDQSEARMEHEERRLTQKDEMVTLAWDKHLRDSAAIAERIKGDEQIAAVKQSSMDYSGKIELIGRRMFNGLWRKRASSTRGPNMPPGMPPVMTPDGLPQEDREQTDDNLVLEGEEKTAEQELSPTTKDLKLQISDLKGAKPEGDGAEEAENAEQKETKGTEETQTADQQVSPTTVQDGPVVIGEKDVADECQGSTAHSCGVSPTNLENQTAREYARPTKAADQQVSPTMTHDSPETVCEKSEVNECQGSRDSRPTKTQEATELEYNLRDIEWLMRQGKTLEEAHQILRARFKAWKAWRKNGSMGPNPMHAAPEPNYCAPNPGPTPPFYGPCEPPVTSASLRNLW